MRFVALYAGDTLAKAKLIALTADPETVRAVARGALLELNGASSDPAAQAVDEGRRKALKNVLKGGGK